MTRDPNQLFVINAIKLSDIVENCNDGIENGGWEHPDGNNSLTVDDERLTDKLCQEFADSLAGSFEDEDQEIENEVNAVNNLLEAMGFIYQEDPADELANVLQTQIEQLENELAAKKAMLQGLQ